MNSPVSYGVLMVLGLLVTTSQSLASPYAFNLDRASVQTATQGTGVDEFDGSSLHFRWVIGDPTVTVSGGFATLSSPGAVFSETVNGVPLMFESTYFESTFYMEDFPGDFTGTAVWAAGVPGLTQHYAVSLDRQHGAAEVVMGVSNFTTDVADAVGVPAGPAIWFGKSADSAGGGGSTDFDALSLDPSAILGAIVMSFSFDDSADLMTGNFSLDGGTTFQSPFSAVSFLPGGQSRWGFQAASITAVPLPAAIWLFGSALGLIGLPLRRRRQPR